MKEPNVLIVLVDDMGYGDFGKFNDGVSQTPTLDSLIDESVCLTQHYTASPVCNPSRACLLTGRYPHRTGSLDTLEWYGLERLALRETTLADLFKSAGYSTGLVGKWHLGAFDDRYHPMRRGFDETVCFRGGMHDYFQWRIEWGDQARRTDGRYLTDLWTDEAVSFINRHSHEEKPFFLHVTFNAPHTPLQAPAEDVALFRDNEALTEGVRILYGMIHRMDAGVSRILEALKANGVADDTIVLFSSDNGPQFGGQGDMRINRFNCGFNGSKGTTYEGGIRVPGIIRWPAGGLSGGREISDMVHFSDWFPTLLALTGVELPKDHLPIDGVDVSAVLRGDSSDVCSERYWQWCRFEPEVTSNAAVRDGAWKLVRPAIRETMDIGDPKWLAVSMYGPEHFIHNGVIGKPYPARSVPAPPPPELYNLDEDPLEKHNLASSEPDRVSTLLRKLETWFEAVEADRACIDDRW